MPPTSHLAQPATIADVAAASGVARSTVSRVMNNDRTFSLRQELRDRVLSAASELNYRPRLAAKSLRARDTRLIGLLGSSNVHAASGLTNEMIRVLVNDLHARAFDVFTSFPHLDRAEGSLPPWQFDAAVVTSGDDGRAQDQLARMGTPYVCMNAANPPKDAWAVEVDEAMGMALAIDHLVDAGHRRIAYLTQQSAWMHNSEQARERAYASELRRRGLPVLPGRTERRVPLAQSVRNWVAHQATAVVVYDHLHAVRLLGVAADLGVSVPGDLSVVCYNNEFPVADVRPALTAVAISASQVAGPAVELLLDRMKSSPLEVSPRRVLVPVSLVERQSVARLKPTD